MEIGDIIIEETGRFIRIKYNELNKDGLFHEIFLSEEEAKGVCSFLKNYDYSNIRRVIKLDNQ